MLARFARVSWVLYATVAGLMMLPGLHIGPSLDAGVFGVVGWRVASGDILYVDVWDHKPPGVFVPSILANLLTESPRAAWTVIWVMTVLCAAGTALAVERILRDRGIGWSAQLAALLAAMALGSYLVTLGGGLGESYAVLPATLGFAAVAARPRGLRNWLLAGVAVGVAGIVSLQSLSVLGALAILGLASPTAMVARRAAAFAGGVVAVAAIAVGVLAAGAALPGALDAVVAYNSAYRSVGSNAGADAPGGLVLLPWVFLTLLPLVPPAAMALSGSRRHDPHRDLTLACVAWIVVGVMAIWTQGRLYGHYATPLVVPLAILAGVGFQRMAETTTGSLRRRLVVATPVVVATGIALSVGAVGATMEQRWIRGSNERAASLGPVVAKYATEADSLLVWGNEPQLYLASQRSPALRYPYMFPLTTAGYATPELIRSLAEDLVADPPAVIVDAGSAAPGEPGMPPLLIGRPVVTDGRNLDILDPLRTVIANAYEERETVGGWVVYVRRSR